MTDIKCRYTIPYCSYLEKYTRLYHNEFWWCDDNSNCQENHYTMPKNSEVINEQCVYCEYRSGEFEKCVKRYEYANGVLTVAGKNYYANEIDYLEIDGRVLINEQAESEDNNGTQNK